MLQPGRRLFKHTYANWNVHKYNFSDAQTEQQQFLVQAGFTHPTKFSCKTNMFIPTERHSFTPTTGNHTHNEVT